MGHETELSSSRWLSWPVTGHMHDAQEGCSQLELTWHLAVLTAPSSLLKTAEHLKMCFGPPLALCLQCEGKMKRLIFFCNEKTFFCWFLVVGFFFPSGEGKKCYI